MPKNKSRRLHSKGGDGDSNIVPTPTSTSTPTSSKPKSNSNGILNFFSSAWNDTTNNTKNMYDNLMGKKSNTNTSSLSSSSTPVVYNSQQPTPISASTSLTDYKSTGGRKTKKKGGGPAPVNGLAVAKPTYWIKGGKKTKGKRRRSSKKRSNRRR